MTGIASSAEAAALPILTHDIVVDRYSNLETRYANADAVLVMGQRARRWCSEYLARVIGGPLTSNTWPALAKAVRIGSAISSIGSMTGTDSAPICAP